MKKIQYRFKSVCFYCGHSPSWHTPNKGCAFVIWNSKKKMVDVCECLKYRPTNNLEYLEWKYDQKN
jgi:hypothetical protein